MAKRGKWNERLHPRGVGGKFASKGTAVKAAVARRRAANKPANDLEAYKRKQGYKNASIRAGLGVAVGAHSIAVGHGLGDKTRTKMGVNRIGVAAVHGAHHAATVRRQTSVGFHAQSAKDKRIERNRSLQTRARFEVGSALSDALLLSYNLPESSAISVRGMRNSAANKLIATTERLNAPPKPKKAPSMAKSARKLRYSSKRKRSASMDSAIKRNTVKVRADQNIFMPSDPFAQVSKRYGYSGKLRAGKRRG